MQQCFWKGRYNMGDYVYKQPYGCCEWKFIEDCEGDGHYETNCGNAFIFTEGNVCDNDFEYCPYCGRTILADK